MQRRFRRVVLVVMLVASQAATARAGRAPRTRTALRPDPVGTVYPSGAGEPALLRGEEKHVGWSISPRGTLFVDGPSPRDVKQSKALGDCGLDATLASAAKTQPKMLERALVRNADGTVTLAAHTTTLPTWVRIDAEGRLTPDDPSQPLATTSLQPITVSAAIPRRASLFSGWAAKPGLLAGAAHVASPNPDELWAPLTEKAFASVYRTPYVAEPGYAQLDGIHAWDAMTMLTGKQSVFFYKSDNTTQQLYAALARATSDKRLVVAATTRPSLANTAVATLAGMYNDHYYSVLGTHEAFGLKWVTLYDPHGERLLGVGDATFSVPLQIYAAVTKQTEIN